MTFREFTEKLKTPSEIKLVLIHGENAYLKQRALEAVIHVFNTDDAGLDIDRFDEKAETSDIMLACDTLPFAQEKRIVIVNDFGGLKSGAKTGDAMAEYTAQIPSHAVLVFVMSDGADKRKKLYKAIKKHGLDAELNNPTEGELVQWIIAEFAQEGKKTTREQAHLMITLCGQDMVSLKGEIEKLCAYTDGDVISTSDIRYIVSKSLEYNVFLLHDYLIKKDISGALALYQDIIETEKSPFGVLGLIASKFRMMFKGRALLDANYPQDRAISLMGGHPYAAKIALKECRAFSAEQLIDGIRELAELDYRIKSGGADAALAVEAVLLKIYGVTA